MIYLSRSTACFAVRLLLSVAVVYRFFPAENKSIFAQRYGPCTPPDGTKHTNVRRAGTKYKTIVKEAHCALIPCGFSALAALAKMQYTGEAEINVKEITPSVKPCGFASSLGEGASGGSGKRPRPLRRLRASSPKGRASGVPHTLRLKWKLYRYAKGPISEGAVTA